MKNNVSENETNYEEKWIHNHVNIVEELADQITKHILKQLDADHIHEIKEKSPIDPDFFFGFVKVHGRPSFQFTGKRIGWRNRTHWFGGRRFIGTIHQ